MTQLKFQSLLIGIDELTEVGTYRLQIQLYGHNAEDHRITIPPVEFYVEEPM